MKFIYRGELYNSVDEVDEAICERIGEQYNNIDPMDTVEFEDEWRYEVETVEDTWFAEETPPDYSDDIFKTLKRAISLYRELVSIYRSELRERNISLSQRSKDRVYEIDCDIEALEVLE